MSFKIITKLDSNPKSKVKIINENGIKLPSIYIEETINAHIRDILLKYHIVPDIIKLIIDYNQSVFEGKTIRKIIHKDIYDDYRYNFEIITNSQISIFDLDHLQILNLNNNSLQTFPENINSLQEFSDHNNSIESILYINDNLLAIYEKKIFRESNESSDFGNIKILDIRNRKYIKTLENVFVNTKIRINF